MREYPDSIQLSRQTFSRILGLTQTRDWLINRSQEFHALLSECETEEQANLVFEIIERLHFIDSEKLYNLSKETVRHLIENFSPIDNSSVFIGISDDFSIDGSDVFLSALRNGLTGVSSINNKSFINKMSGNDNVLKRRKTIFLVDDFTGTGNTMIRKYRWMEKKLNELENKKAKVVAISIASSVVGVENLRKEGITFYAPYTIEKCITDNFPDNNNELISEMKAIESRLSARHNGHFRNSYSLGYGRCECAYHLEPYNTPNNVFPIFWWPRNARKQNRLTIFPRKL